MTIGPPSFCPLWAISCKSSANSLKYDGGPSRRAGNIPLRPLHLPTTFALLAILVLCGNFGFVHASNSRAPVLLSDNTSTRAIAVESVTLRPEPFALTASVNFGQDTRTRICIFAMSLDLLVGEGANAFTAEMEDGSGRRYSLLVEYVGRVPDFDGISMVVVRLADDLGDAGDVLLRLNLHGMASNRVRVAIGHRPVQCPAIDCPSDDPGAVATPAPSTPPPADPVFSPDPYLGAASDADTVRFLEQASWGPSTAELNRVRAMGFRAYLSEQFSLPSSGYPNLSFPPDDSAQGCPTGSPAECIRDNYSMYPIQRTFFTNTFSGQDQLRQRVAFALHQIFVISGRDINRPSAMTPYVQALDRNAFGNFRTLLGDVTLNPGMGEYLDMVRSTRTNPNENFAREILQLFSIGVNELNLDGSVKTDAQGVAVPSYSQSTVNEFTRVFTGWRFETSFSAGVTNFRDPMVPRGSTTHDVGAKTLLNSFTLPACTGTNAACAQSDLASGLDNIFNHPNVGPFIGKQLIQHLVTSNPSRAYVERVARVFNNDCDALYPEGCTGVRGNMRAVVQAILLDPEARGDMKTDPNYGKLREPVQFIAAVLRGFDVKSFDKGSTSDGVLASRSTTDFPGSMDQPLFLPATVFSYYQPDYVIPGSQLLGPTFGILSTTTTLRRANYVNSMIYSGIAPSTPPNTDRPRGTSLDLSPLESLASTPDQILDPLNRLFLHGMLSAEMRASILSVMNSIPTSDPNFARKRAQAAAYLTTTSSQYEIQR